MADVVLDGVSKSFGRDIAVADISMEVPDGAFVVLLGPTGAGKTTTLRLISGLEEPDRGDIRIAGHSVAGLTPAQRDVAMVFQQYSLYPHMTVRENLAFPLKSPILKTPAEQIAKRVAEVAEILQISHKLDNKATALSGGEMQRVSIGRALVRRPNVYLMDEPLSSLDAKLRADLRVELKRIQSDLGATLLYVTHDQIEAMTMADKIVVMRDGRVEQIGSPLDLYDHPKNVFVAGFIGSPSMNFVHGTIAVKDGKKVFVSDHGLELPVPENNARTNQAVTYGIRPEHIQVGDQGVPMKVVVVEPTGSETQVFAKSGPELIDALVKDRISAKPGSELCYMIDPANVHLFDRETEQRI